MWPKQKQSAKMVDILSWHWLIYLFHDIVQTKSYCCCSYSSKHENKPCVAFDKKDTKNAGKIKYNDNDRLD